MDWQRVHIRSQTNHPSLRIRLAFDHSNHTCLPDARNNLIHTKLFESLLHKGSRFVHVKHQFGMLMQVAPPASDFFVHLRNSITDRHDIFLLR